MILTIAQYIEALVSPGGRSRTLERLHSLSGEDGVPVFSMPGHGLVDFEVMTLGKRYTLRCPLRWSDGAPSALRTLGGRDRGLGSRFFTEWKLLESEIVLFDAEGRPFEVDILARPTPEGEPLVDFLEKAAFRGDTAAASAALRSFEELVLWAHSVARTGIALRKLLASPDGELSVTGFSAVGEIARIRELLDAAARGETAGARKDDREHAGYDLDGEGEIRCVRDGGGWIYVDGRGHAITGAVWTSSAPFRGDRAEVETPTGKGLIDTGGRTVLEPVHEEVVWDDGWGVAAVMADGAWSLVDRDGALLTTETYDWLGECSEGLLLAQKGGKCGFIDTLGREAIPFLYDDASSFSEGLAFVSLGAGGRSESFFIDAGGKRI